MAAANITTIKTAQDVAAMDISALSPTALPNSLYEAIITSAGLYPNNIAIEYILDGECLGNGKIPFAKKLVHFALSKLKGKQFAAPYREITYAELAHSVTQIANGLHKLGLGRDDVCSIVMPNFPEMYFSLWGASTAGIANPINPLLDSSIIKAIATSANSQVLIALGPVPGSDIWEKVLQIKEDIPTLKAVISVFGDNIPKSDSNRVPVISLDQLMRDQNNEWLEFPPPAQHHDCAYFHTGGTTGLPKLARHTHLNQLTNAAQVNVFSSMTKDDAIFVGLPIFHVNAAVATGIAPVMQGGRILLASPAGYRGKFIMDNLFTLLERFNINYVMAVPTVYAGLLAAIEKQGAAAPKLPNMKLAICGAAPLSSDLQQRFIETTGIALIEGYGSTESSSVSTLMPVNAINTQASVGLAIPNSDLRIIEASNDGESFRQCEVDEVGEIVIAGNNVFAGYLDEAHNQQLTLTIDGKRFVRTGDLGKLDDKGYLALAGRKKELIIRGGHNIDPKMIEDIALQHEAVYLAAAIPRPDKYSGELPVLYASLKPTSTLNSSDAKAKSGTLTESELLTFLQDNVPERAAIPKYVRIIDDMPLTSIGKQYKPALVCDEIRRVIEDDLSQVMKDNEWSVQVTPDKTHGVVATITLEPIHSEGSQAPQQTQVSQHKAMIDRALMEYTFTYVVNHSSTNAMPS